VDSIESLNAEKAKLESEKKDLRAKLEGEKKELEVSEAVAIRQQITGIDARITDIDARITASINAPPKPLSMDDVTKWLDNNALAVDQPEAPTSCGGNWGKSHSTPMRLNGLAMLALTFWLGVSGAGKTRSMYEVLSHRFGFYWTCSRLGNGGSSRLNSEIGNLPERLTDVQQTPCQRHCGRAFDRVFDFVVAVATSISERIAAAMACVSDDHGGC
jgi:hypothetical protein